MLNPHLSNTSTLPLVPKTSSVPRDYPTNPAHGPSTAHYLKSVLLTRPITKKTTTAASWISAYAPSSSSSPPVADFITTIVTPGPTDQITVTEYGLNCLPSFYERKQILDLYRILFRYVHVKPEDLASWQAAGMEVMIKNCLVAWDEWWASKKGVPRVWKTSATVKRKGNLAKKAEDALKMPPPKRPRAEPKSVHFEQPPVTRGRRGAFSLGQGENLGSVARTPRTVGLGFGTRYGVHAADDSRNIGGLWGSRNKRSGHVFDHDSGWKDEKYPTWDDELDEAARFGLGYAVDASKRSKGKGKERAKEVVEEKEITVGEFGENALLALRGTWCKVAKAYGVEL